MPTDTERRLEQLENLLLFGGGVAAGTASGRALARRAVPAAVRLGGRVAVANPYAVAALLAYEGYIHRDQIADIAAGLTQQLREPSQMQQETTRPVGELGLGPQYAKARKRTVSKANKAVKYAMGLLKTGTKASTGADKGKLVKGAFKMATVAAGLANPRTPSRIKGKGRIKNLARKLKRWW